MNENPETRHPDYDLADASWTKVRDTVAGEAVIKSKTETYLPRPAGMSGEYADAYDSYLQRAHFPLISSYALQGVLGIITTKIPEFNVPKGLEYILKNATKDGLSISQLFLDTMIEVLQTGRVPLMVDIDDTANEFRMVRYQAESFINWKTELVKAEKNLKLAVFTEDVEATDDVFSHDTTKSYATLQIDPTTGTYIVVTYGSGTNVDEGTLTIPVYMGKPIDEIPVFIAGSINNSYDIQPIPLLSVANCSLQIYMKEADLNQAEFMSCNPTLVLTGINESDSVPNVVGSAVMLLLPDPQSTAKYTMTDTSALQHVSSHIDNLYEEAIRHGVALLQDRKGVESAEALRLRQSSSSATIYSMYLSSANAILECLKLMCRWGGFNEEEVKADMPASLTQEIPDSNVMRELIFGFTQGTTPLRSVYRYNLSSGLIDSKVSFDEYVESLKEYPPSLTDPIANANFLSTTKDIVPEDEEVETKSNNAQ